MSNNILLSIVNDSDSLFKVITQSSNMTEKRLMIDIQAGREAYHDCEINNMGWIKSEGNLADGFRKLNKSDMIQRKMRTVQLNVISDQWAI